MDKFNIILPKFNIILPKFNIINHISNDRYISQIKIKNFSFSTSNKNFSYMSKSFEEIIKEIPYHSQR